MAAPREDEGSKVAETDDGNATSEEVGTDTGTAEIEKIQDGQSATHDEVSEGKFGGEFKAPTFQVPSLKLNLTGKQQTSKSKSDTSKVGDNSDTVGSLSKKGERDIAERPPVPNLTKGSTKPEKPATESLPTSSKRTTKSPAELLTAPPPLPYREPQWSGLPELNYSLDVLKNGCIVANIPLNDKPFHVFGRLDICDVPLEHPSVSRYHAILQYRAFADDEHTQSFYIYDLNSTHGTFLNKSQLTAKTYYRMRVGYMFKLGGSSRNYILQGPDEDQEEESKYTVTELKEMRQKQMEKLEALEKDEEGNDDDDDKGRKEEEVAKQEEDTGIDWGMGDDAVEEDMAENPFAILEPKEPLDLKDPKKTLRGFFEREGEELEYETDEKGFGHSRQFVCRVRLPLDDANGQPIYAEAAVSGKKKEAVLACALEACRILDNHGVLRQATHESKKRKAKNWEDEDYYDSDDDTFLDRTGMIEKKRLQRMKRAGKEESVVDTYDSLMTKFAAVEKEVNDVEKQLAEKESLAEAEKASGEDALDAFMKSIKEGKGTDKISRSKLKLKLFDLRKEKARLERLIKIAKPTALPELVRPAPVPSTKKSESTKQVMVGRMPMIGAMKRGKISFKKLKTEVSSTSTVKPKMDEATEEEEEEEQGEQDDGLPVAMETANLQVQKDSVISPDLEESECDEKILEGKSRLPDKSEEMHVPRDHELREESLSPDILSKDVEKASSAADKSEHTAASVDSKVDKKRSKPQFDYEAEEDDRFATWMPPKGQTGDGRTHLNEKYGY